jgi:hypothetical protein
VGTTRAFLIDLDVVKVEQLNWSLPSGWWINKWCLQICICNKKQLPRLVLFRWDRRQRPTPRIRSAGSWVKFQVESKCMVNKLKCTIIHAMVINLKDFIPISRWSTIQADCSNWPKTVLPTDLSAAQKENSSLNLRSLWSLISL